MSKFSITVDLGSINIPVEASDLDEAIEKVRDSVTVEYLRQYHGVEIVNVGEYYEELDDDDFVEDVERQSVKESYVEEWTLEDIKEIGNELHEDGMIETEMTDDDGREIIRKLNKYYDPTYGTNYTHIRELILELKS